MMLVFQDKVGHGAVAVFSEETQQQTAEKSLQQISIKKTGLIKHCHINSSLLFLNTILDWEKVLEVYFGLTDIVQGIQEHWIYH